MAIDRIHLALSFSDWKLPAGPMISPSPGPTLARAVAAPDTEVTMSSPVIASAQDYYVDPELAWDDLPEQWYFYCEIHPAMNGVGQVVADG